MPKFATISPTDISGKKKEAWENFRTGGYISFGYIVADNLTSKSIDEIKKIVYLKELKFGERIAKKRSSEYERFFSLGIGDYIAVNNTNDGLFGIGIIKSDYYYNQYGHNTGSTNRNEFYCHFKNVDWIVTSYMKRKEIIKSGETGWSPYGIISNLLPEIPQYIKRILSGKGLMET